MTSLSFLFKKFLSDDIRVQIEAGYLTNEGKFTEDGSRTLLQGIYEGRYDGSAYLTERAKDLIERRKADKN